MPKTLSRSLLALLLGLLALPAVTAARPAPAQDAGELTEKIVRSRDDADPELIRQLANLRSRAAAEGLLAAYEAMGSVYMKREVLRGLALLDGVAEAEQLALEKVANVATDSKEIELREEAVRLLGAAEHLGKHYLQVIVESPANDDVREQAMRQHVSRAEPSDDAWYRALYEPEKEGQEVDPRTKKKKDDEEAAKQLAVHRLGPVRRMAFEALLPRLSMEELVGAMEDRSAGVRRLALEEIHRRDPKAAYQRARELFEDIEEHVDVRALAARILAEEEGPRIADEFIDEATKFVTPTRLRMELADLLAGFGDERVNKKLVKLVGRGKEYEQLFALRAAGRLDEKGLDKKILRMLGDREPAIAMAAADMLAQRGVADEDVLEALEKVIEKSRDDDVVAAGLDAMSRLRSDDPEWRQQLLEYAASEDAEVRNAALLQLGRSKSPDALPVLTGALSHDLWSTRYAALRGLEALRVPEVVPLLIERMPEEQGRMLHEFADALFRLTAQPFRTSTGSWKAWWEREGGDGFQLAKEDQLDDAREAQEERRLKQLTNVDFFGIRIDSHRVIFIIDVSGSMNEPTRGKYVGETGELRMTVAQRELKKAVDGLDPRALFNIITFSGGIGRWLDSGVSGSTGKSRDEAKEWVDRLGAMGATNLYDAVQAAFEDPDVDTIFVLSDGEPTAGAQTDPYVIREHVADWNEHRGIVIHTISVGLDLPVLEWLAEDSGGKHVKFR